MSAPKRSKEQRNADMNRLAVLYVKRIPQSVMAEEMGVSQGQISQDIKKLLQKWESEQINQIDRYKHEELTRINSIEAEMWEQWELSKGKGNKTIFKSTSGKIKKKDPSLDTATNFIKNPEFWREEQTEESSSGNMEYMRGIMWCIEERCKIIGLHAPKKLANTNPEGDKEAGADARRELLDMISRVADRLNPSQNPVEKVIDVEARQIETTDLAGKIKEDRMSRLLPATIPTRTV